MTWQVKRGVGQLAALAAGGGGWDCRLQRGANLATVAEIWVVLQQPWLEQ